MKIEISLLAASWLVIPYIIYEIVGMQGKAIGGSQYFAHVGILPGILVEYLWAAVAIGIAGLLTIANFTKFRPWQPILALSILFAVGVFYTYLPLFFPELGRFAFVPLATFPLEFHWFLKPAVALGFVTSIVVAFRRAA